MNKILSQRIPCVVAGDFNIDLLKFDNHTATKDFLHSLLTNNFTPTVLLPSRITSKSTSLIDHIYINKGQKNNSAWFDSHIKSGNLLTDISDHLPNFTLILNNPTDDIKLRPKVRIFSKNNLTKFKESLQSVDWNSLYNECDVNKAYNKFDSVQHFINRFQ